MNILPSDLGGIGGLGNVTPESDESLFHADWEKRVLAIVLALGKLGKWNIDESRHSREQIPYNDYINFSYYHIWLEGIEKLLLQHNLVTPQELQSGESQSPPAPIDNILTADKVWDNLHSLSGIAERPTDTLPTFALGDIITTATTERHGHTRLPSYARGHSGEITKILGHHVFPDSSASGKGENPQWLYQVTFTAKELWNSDTHDCVTLDLWESYLVGK